MGPKVLLVLCAMAVTSPVMAKSEFMEDARTAYPQITGTRLDSCSLCHSSIPSKNSYGFAYESAGRSFAAINGVDSDGDTYTNLAEIMARTFPGDSTDRPSGEGEGEGEGEGGCSLSGSDLASKLNKRLGDLFLLGVMAMAMYTSRGIYRHP